MLRAVLFPVEVLAYALWEGGMVALALVAPVVFQVVPSRDLAGRVFGGILGQLFPLIYACGAAILLSGLIQRRFGHVEIVRYVLVALMLAVALYTGIVVVGEMNGIQAALPAPIEALPLDSPPRARFDDLHRLSERLIGADVGLGLVLLPYLVRRRPVVA